MSEPIIESAPQTPAPSAARQRSVPSRRLLYFSVVAAILACGFASSLLNFVRFALSNDRTNYLLVIPALFGYLVWTDRANFPRDFRSSYAPALVAAISGFVAVAAAFGPARQYALSLEIAGLLLLMFSAALVFLGSAALRTISFPIAFLIFAIPLPAFAVRTIDIFLQHTSAEAAYWMLSMTPVPMLREGLTFQLPGMPPLQVAEECSGFNSTWVLFIVSTLAGHLFLSKPRNKLFLSLFVVPLAILRNGFRITVIALLCVYIDPSMIDSFIHRHGGPFFFALSMIPFILFLGWLRKREGKGWPNKL